MNAHRPAPDPPKAARPPAVLLGAEVVLSVLAAVAAISFAVVAFRGEHYFMLAGQGLALVAAGFGVLAGRGRFSDGPALAPACVGGALLTAAVVGGLETQVLSIDGEITAFGGPGSRAAVATHAALAALFGVLAALVVLARTPARSGKYLLAGALVGSPALALAVAWRLGYIARAQESLPAVAFQLAVLGAALVVIVLVSVAAHCIIRAFEVGVDAADPAGPTSGGAASENPGS